jgi:hypothetical protein
MAINISVDSVDGIIAPCYSPFKLDVGRAYTAICEESACIPR